MAGENASLSGDLAGCFLTSGCPEQSPQPHQVLLSRCNQAPKEPSFFRNCWILMYPGKKEVPRFLLSSCLGQGCTPSALPLTPASLSRLLAAFHALPGSDSCFPLTQAEPKFLQRKYPPSSFTPVYMRSLMVKCPSDKPRCDYYCF